MIMAKSLIGGRGLLLIGLSFLLTPIWKHWLVKKFNNGDNADPSYLLGDSLRWKIEYSSEKVTDTSNCIINLDYSIKEKNQLWMNANFGNTLHQWAKVCPMKMSISFYKHLVSVEISRFPFLLLIDYSQVNVDFIFYKFKIFNKCFMGSLSDSRLFVLFCICVFEGFMSFGSWDSFRMCPVVYMNHII